MTIPSGSASRRSRRQVAGWKVGTIGKRQPAHRDEADDDDDEVAGGEADRGRDEPPVGVVGRDDEGGGRVGRERDRRGP